MNEKNNKIFTYIFWAGVIACIIWLFLSSGKKPETKSIRREFNNGKIIEVPVDRLITKDNWKCTSDCSGHEAGYEWAEEKGITDPSDCGGKSESFIEGCEAYANENSEDY
jgi:hypothetical protein